MPLGNTRPPIVADDWFIVDVTDLRLVELDGTDIELTYKGQPGDTYMLTYEDDAAARAFFETLRRALTTEPVN
jgi:hypothetical protein